MDVKRAYDHTLSLPTYGTPGAAAIDLSTPIGVTLFPGQQTLVPTGWCFEIPKSFVGIIKDRSSLANRGLYTSAGVIDSDYRGEVLVMLRNSSKETVRFDAGERIAQMVFVYAPQFEFKEVEELSATDRGEGGFGSTGK